MKLMIIARDTTSFSILNGRYSRRRFRLERPSSMVNGGERLGTFGYSLTLVRNMRPKSIYLNALNIHETGRYYALCHIAMNLWHDCALSPLAMLVSGHHNPLLEASNKLTILRTLNPAIGPSCNPNLINSRTDQSPLHPPVASVGSRDSGCNHKQGQM